MFSLKSVALCEDLPTTTLLKLYKKIKLKKERNYTMKT